MNQCKKYSNYFVNRGYSEKDLIKTAKEVNQQSRDKLLSNPIKKRDQDRIVFVCDWHPKLSQLPGMIKKNHHILQEDNKLKHIFKEPPVIAFRRAKTIKNHVVRNDVAPPVELKGPTQPCGKCSICKMIDTSDTLINIKNGKQIKIDAGGTCRTSDIVYAAKCKRCKLIYVGETGKELRSRFCDHRYDAKSRPDNCKLSDHIHQHHHNFESDIEVSILKKWFTSTDERKYWEDKFICILGSKDESTNITEKTGLNKKLGNYAKEMYHLHQNF